MARVTRDASKQQVSPAARISPGRDPTAAPQWELMRDPSGTTDTDQDEPDVGGVTRAAGQVAIGGLLSQATRGCEASALME